MSQPQPQPQLPSLARAARAPARLGVFCFLLCSLLEARRGEAMRVNTGVHFAAQSAFNSDCSFFIPYKIIHTYSSFITTRTAQVFICIVHRAGEFGARSEREAAHRDAAAVSHALRRAPRVHRARVLRRMLRSSSFRF